MINGIPQRHTDYAPEQYVRVRAINLAGGTRVHFAAEHERIEALDADAYSMRVLMTELFFRYGCKGDLN